METFKHFSRIWLFLVLCCPNNSKGKQLFNTNTHRVSPKSETVAVHVDGRGSINDTFTITNFGIARVYAVLQAQPHRAGSFYVMAAKHVMPEETVTMNLTGIPSPFVRLVIRNVEEKGAVVYAGRNDKYANYRDRGGAKKYLNIDGMALLKSVTTFAAGYVPFVGGALSAIIDFFWQPASPDVWSQISGKVEKMVDEKYIDLVSSIVSNKIRRYKKRIWAFNTEFKEGPEDANDTYITTHYINLAQDLFGLEEEFVMDRFRKKNRKTNYILLPYFCKVVSLQMAIYNFGLSHQKELKLERTAMRSLQMYKNAILYTPSDGAQDYVYESYLEHMKYVFSDCADGEEIYNCMMNVRTYITLNGLQYSDQWSQSLNSKLEGYKPLACTPTFSTYLGRPSHEIHRIGSSIYEPEQLLPGYANGHCTRLMRVDVFNCDSVLCGLKTYMEDDSEHLMGIETRDYTKIELKNHVLRRISVYGWEYIEGIQFFFDSENWQTAGRARGQNLMGTFEVKDHYIAGILVTNGVKTTNPKALANIAVSYIAEAYA